MSAIAEINKIAKEAQKIVNAQRSPDVSGKKIPKEWGDFVKLISIQSGAEIVNFNPYPYQLELDKCFNLHHTVISVKSRQMGWTTYAGSKGLHKAILNPAYTAVFISRTGADASLIAYNVRQMLNSIPEYAEAINDNLLIIRIKNGGTLHFRSPGPNATRGIHSVSDIFIDEAAFIPEVELLYGQIKRTQSMVKNSRTLIISTPNTVTDWYYQQLTEGDGNILNLINEVREGKKRPIQILEDESGWAKFICHWKAHPVYSQIPDYLEFVAKRDKIPMPQVLREIDLSFEDNVMNVFSLNLVNQCFTLEKDEEINENAEYYFGIDTNGGGQDYCVCTVLKVIDGKIYLVNYYRNRTNTTPVHLDRISQLIKKYKPYRVSVETNAGGKNYYDLIKDNFPSLDLNEHFTSESSKANIIVKLLYLMENDEFKGLNQQVIREEFLSFQKIGKKYEAIQGKHDDIVMSTAIGCSGIRFYK